MRWWAALMLPVAVVLTYRLHRDDILDDVESMAATAVAGFGLGVLARKKAS